MKKELILKLVVTFIGIVVVALVGVFLLKENTSETKGNIIVEVIDLKGEKVIDDKVRNILLERLKDHMEGI